MIKYLKSQGMMIFKSFDIKNLLTSKEYKEFLNKNKFYKNSENKLKVEKELLKYILDISYPIKIRIFTEDNMLKYLIKGKSRYKCYICQTKSSSKNFIMRHYSKHNMYNYYLSIFKFFNIKYFKLECKCCSDEHRKNSDYVKHLIEIMSENEIEM